VDLSLLVLVAARVWGQDAATVLGDIDVEAAQKCVAAANQEDEDPLRQASALLSSIVRRRPFRRDNDVMALLAAAQLLGDAGVVVTFEADGRLRDLLVSIRSGDASLDNVVDHILERAQPQKQKEEKKETKERTDMFERFTPRARQVMAEAKHAAEELQHNFIGTEHLLLGLLGVEEGIGAQVLRDLGVTGVAVRRQVQDRAGPGPKAVVDHFPFTPRSKQALELSLRRALRLGNDYIGTEHMLLGLLEVRDGLACQILDDLGVTLAIAEARITAALVALGWTPSKRVRRRLRLKGFPDVTWQPTRTPTQVRNQRLLGELSAIVAENDALRSEVSRLRHLLAEHRIDPGPATSGEQPA
jgi:hypothetical protein